MFRRFSRAIAVVVVFAGLLGPGVASEAATKAKKQAKPKARKAAAVFADSAIRRVQVPGAELAYVIRGTGESLVLLHPTGLDFRAWLGQIDPLSSRYRVVAYSRRHHYPNGAPGKGADESMAVHVRDLTALIRELNLGRVHLVGHSEGATIATLFAFEHPDLVRKLVLADPALPGLLDGTPSDSAFVAQRRQVLTLASMALRDGFDQLGIERWVDWEYGDAAIIGIPRPVQQQMLDNVGVLRRSLGKTPAGPPLGCSELAKIPSPVLVVDGDRSPWYVREICKTLATCRPETRRVTLKGTSHEMPWSKAGDFNRTVSEFLGGSAVAGDGN